MKTRVVKAVLVILTIILATSLVSKSFPMIVGRSFQQVIGDFLHGKSTLYENSIASDTKTSPNAEFAMLKQTFSHEIIWNHTWLGSTKKIIIRGEYVAKAGFDLQDPFQVKIDPATGKPIISLPPAKILSIVPKEAPTIDCIDGWWNKIQLDEQELALKTFEEQIRKKATASGIVEQAQREALSRIQDLAEKNRISTNLLKYLH